jgi:5-formyltetrahydrofolate cyclo-ligase
VMLYMAMQDEPSMGNLIQRCWNDWIKVCLPKVISASEMIAVEVADQSDIQDRYLWTVQPNQSTACMQQHDLIAVPGMAFDRSWHRLWRWKGYYDRRLDRAKYGLTVWVAFSIQLLPELPTDRWDVAVNQVVCFDDYRE